MGRPIEELQEDIRTLTRICGFAINDKLSEIAEEVGEVYQQGRADLSREIEQSSTELLNCKQVSEDELYFEYMRGYDKGRAEAIESVIDSLNIMHDMTGLDNHTLDVLIKSLEKKNE